MIALWLLAAVPHGELLTSLQGKGFDERVVLASEGYLGTRYQLSPVGEGSGKDPDPVWSDDAVDCVTYVEQVLALARSGSDGELVTQLNQLRYGSGEPKWENRNHVMEAQWVPQNLRKGLIEDVTEKYAGKATLKAVKTLTAKTWGFEMGAQLELPETLRPTGTYSWPMVPAAKALKLLKAVPEGTLVLVVRGDREKSVTRVSHMAFLVHHHGELFLRHASKSFGKVVDEPLSKYLGRNLEYAKWTVEGFSLYRARPTSEAPR